MVDENVTFTPERGGLEASTDAPIKIVQDATTVSFEIIPEHAIYKDDLPEILIEFPPEIQINTLQCKISDVSMDGSTLATSEQCFRNQQTFQIKTFLAEDYIPALPGEPPRKIYFTVGDVTNAVSV